jgi:hypothetical protein
VRARLRLNSSEPVATADFIVAITGGVSGQLSARTAEGAQHQRFSNKCSIVNDCWIEIVKASAKMASTQAGASTVFPRSRLATGNAFR